MFQTLGIPDIKFRVCLELIETDIFHRFRGSSFTKDWYPEHKLPETKQWMGYQSRASHVQHSSLHKPLQSDLLRNTSQGL